MYLPKVPKSCKIHNIRAEDQTANFTFIFGKIKYGILFSNGLLEILIENIIIHYLESVSVFISIVICSMAFFHR